MCFRGRLILCAMLAGTAAAQAGTPDRSGQNDRREAAPVAASSSNYRAAPSLPGTATGSVSPFHFKQRATRGPADQSPPQANDKAAVMGQQRPWQNGRPPADCAVDPRDAACH